jgi:hypothetical protein
LVIGNDEEEGTKDPMVAEAAEAHMQKADGEEKMSYYSCVSKV